MQCTCVYRVWHVITITEPQWHACSACNALLGLRRAPPRAVLTGPMLTRAAGVSNVWYACQGVHPVAASNLPSLRVESVAIHRS